VNRAGKFNVPFGRYDNPRILDEPNLRAAAAALKEVEITEADFETICARARPGDGVYLDPPYVPLSKSSNFTAYDRHPFGLNEHVRLASAFAELGRRGVRAVLSNSHTPETKKLYASFEHQVVKVTRPINSRPNERGPVTELLVVNRLKEIAAEERAALE
jgi:DNA adenine methylase